MGLDTWRLKAQSGQGRAKKEIESGILEQMGKAKTMGLLSLLGGLGSTLFGKILTKPVVAALNLGTGGIGGLMASTLFQGLTSYGIDKGIHSLGKLFGWGPDPSKITTSGPWGYAAQNKAQESLSSALQQREDNRFLNAMISSLFTNMASKEGQKVLAGIGGKGDKLGGSILDKLSELFGGGEKGSTNIIDKFSGVTDAQGNPIVAPQGMQEIIKGNELGTLQSGYKFDRPQGLSMQGGAPKVMGLGSGGTPNVTGLGSGGLNYATPPGSGEISLSKALGLGNVEYGVSEEINPLNLMDSYDPSITPLSETDSILNQLLQPSNKDIRSNRLPIMNWMK